MKNIERIIESQYPPRQTNVAWKDVNDNTLKFYDNGEWKLISDFSQSGDGENSIVQKGSNAVAFGVNSTAFGTSSTNAKERGITENSTAQEIYQEWSSSSPESDKFSLANGEGSVVEGNNNLALGKNSHAEGNGTIAADNSSHSEGTGSQALGKYAHAEGLETVASGERSHSEGQESTASGKTSHAEGKNTTASGENSHSEGQGTCASGKNSHAEGRRDKVLVVTTSFDDRIKSAATESKMYQTLEYSTSAGQYSVGNKLWKISSDGETWTDVYNQDITVTKVYTGDSTWFNFSKKLNIGNKATRYVKILTEWSEEYPDNRGSVGVGSHTEGINTYARNDGEHAEGAYNVSNTGETDAEKTISSIGIGTSMADLKNAVEIMQNGDAYVYGVGGYDGTNAGGNNVSTLQSVIGGCGAGVVVEGGMDSIYFSPSSGQPTYSEAAAALRAGIPVVIKFNDGSNTQTVSIIGEYVDPNGEGVFMYGLRPFAMSVDEVWRWYPDV